MVIWLIGISGSGKTTLGKRVFEYFKNLNMKTYLIDGDGVRKFYDNDLGYSRDERVENIKRILLAAYVLSENGIITIVCNISPFEMLRDFAKKKIGGYNEIYLEKSLHNSIERDINGIYKANMGVTDLVGLDIEFEEPEQSDLVIHVDEHGVEESFQIIIDYIRKRYFEGSDEHGIFNKR